MYERFFGLKDNPFGMTPDPQCYFQSESHREAFAGLSYGIAERRGFMTLVGEVGTGKTTLLNAIMSSLDRSAVTILVRHTTIDREELLRIILHNLYASHGPRQTDKRRRQNGGSLTDSRVAGLSRIELINEFYAFVTGEFMAYQPPPLLIIDEALSVGDGYFQKKCMVHLKRYVDSGGTLLICSHAMYYISAFCKRALWLRDGRIETLGPTQQVVPRYEAFLDAKSDHSDEAPEIVEAGPSAPARIDEVRLLTGSTYRHGTPLELEIRWSCDDPEMAFHLCVGLNRPDEVEVASFLSSRSGAGPWSGSTSHTVRLEIPELPLVKNAFKLYVFLLAEDALHIHDTRILEDAFTVEYDEYPFGIVAIPHRWRVGGEES